MNEQLVEIALAEARRRLENFEPAFRWGMVLDSGFEWVRLPQDFDMDRLNDAPMKDILYSAIRKTVERAVATEVLFVSDAYMGLPTAKQLRWRDEEPEKYKAFMNSHSLTEIEAAGLCRRVEALLIMIQNAERVDQVIQFYDRTAGDRILWGERKTETYAQSKVEGKMKMFGPQETP